MKDAAYFMLRSLVLSIMNEPSRHEWTIQGFGMLRTYLSPELRLHVWDGRYAVRDVTKIHDHPWHFDSLVVSGQIVNTKYRAVPVSMTEKQMERLRRPFLKSQIVCGIDGGNETHEVRARGERVWLIPCEPETFRAGDVYHQQAAEVHHTSYDDGTVTIVKREFLPDTEHAHVFFRSDEEWVSAEPRAATSAEVTDICMRALVNWRAS